MILSPKKIEELIASWVKFPKVDSTCIGCSTCCMVAWDIFKMSDEWLAEVLELDKYNDDLVNEAISVCPVNCISWNK